ncbi:MAG: hypothetical protein AAGJ46_19205 [Planctomycetota bacterium]
MAIASLGAFAAGCGQTVEYLAEIETEPPTPAAAADGEAPPSDSTFDEEPLPAPREESFEPIAEPIPEPIAAGPMADEPPAPSDLGPAAPPLPSFESTPAPEPEPAEEPASAPTEPAQSAEMSLFDEELPPVDEGGEGDPEGPAMAAEPSAPPMPVEESMPAEEPMPVQPVPFPDSVPGGTQVVESPGPSSPPFDELLDPDAAATPEGLPEVDMAADTPPAPPLDDSLAPTPSVDTPPAVAITNTRRLAWLLGSKVSWSALSHLIAPQPAAAEEWEMQALAELLGVESPPESQLASEGATPARAIGQILTDSRRLAAQLSGRHGDDHAALVEVAVKTNVLLVVYEQNPALAGPISDAVTKAADRAGLPSSLWQPLVRLLSDEPSSQLLREEVFRLHGEIDRTLAGSAT